MTSILKTCFFNNGYLCCCAGGNIPQVITLYTHTCTGGHDAPPFEVTLKLSLIVDVFVLLLLAFR